MVSSGVGAGKVGMCVALPPRLQALAGCDPTHASTDAGEVMDAGTPPADPAAVCDALSELACDAWARCGCGDALGWWDLPACVAIARVECAGAIATAEVAEALARGELRFDAVAAQAAIDTASRAAAAGCAPVALDVGRVLAGTRATGGLCARVGDVIDTCADGLGCEAGTCAPGSLGPEGEPCPCEPGLACDASAARGGLCRAAEAAGPLAPGDACTAASECESLLCIERCTPAACRWTLRDGGDAWLVLPGP